MVNCPGYDEQQSLREGGGVEAQTHACTHTQIPHTHMHTPPPPPPATYMHTYTHANELFLAVVYGITKSHTMIISPPPSLSKTMSYYVAVASLQLAI